MQLETKANSPYKDSQGGACDAVRDVMFSDLCGPMHVESWEVAKFFLLLVDCATIYTFIYTLKSKSKVADQVRCFIGQFKTLYEHNVKKLHTDNVLTAADNP